MRLIALGIFAFLFALAYPFCLSDPYHADTTAYMQTVRHFLTHHELKIFYSTRPAAGFLLIPLATWLGEKTLPATMAFGFASSGVLGLMVFRRLFPHQFIVAGFALAMFCPAALISVTHGKEDYLAVALVLASTLILIRGGHLGAGLAGLLFGIALLTKENVLLLYPFLIGVVLTCGLKDSPDPKLPLIVGSRLRDAGLRALVVIVVSLGVVQVVSPSHFSLVLALSDHWSTGQFLGFFSERQSVGLSQWRLALGSFAFYGQGLAILVPFLERAPRLRVLGALFLAQGIMLGLFLANTTVSHYRHFLWPALFLLPMAVYGLYLLCRRVRELPEPADRRLQLIITCGCVLLVAYSLWRVAPALALRGAHNPVATFYRESPLQARVSLAVGMDNCPLARYFTSAPCLTHPKTPNRDEAALFANRIDKALSRGKIVYVLPDFFAYDKDAHLERVIDERFVLEPAYENWYEDYHGLAFEIGGYRRDTIRQLRKRLVELSPTRSEASKNAQTACADHGTYALLEAQLTGENLYVCAKTAYRVRIFFVD